MAATYGVKVIDEYHQLAALPNWESLLCADHIHPSQAGYDIKGQIEAQGLLQ